MAILVESDSLGEGAMIAARLERDRTARVTCCEVPSCWRHLLLERRQYARNTDGRRVGSALDTAGAEYVVFDTSAPPTPDARLLAGFAAIRPGDWRILTRVPVRLAVRPGELLVYRDGPAAPIRWPCSTSMQLGPETGLPDTNL